MRMYCLEDYLQLRCALKMDVIGSFETLTTTYKTRGRGVTARRTAVAVKKSEGAYTCRRDRPVCGVFSVSAW
jgi:hypothetical protein